LKGRAVFARPFWRYPRRKILP